MRPDQDSLYLKIMPIKTFLQLELPKLNPAQIAVIFCTGDRIPTTRLKFKFLHAAFEDVTSGPSALDAKTARRIAVFVDSVTANAQITRLYVCCNVGFSRSPGVGAAVMRYFGQDDTIIWRNPKYCPNVHVYRTLCRAFDLPVSERELKKLVRLNERAYKKAVTDSRK